MVVLQGKYSAAGGGSGGGYVKTYYECGHTGANYSLKGGSQGEMELKGMGGTVRSSWFNSTSTLLAVGGNGAAGVSSYGSLWNRRCLCNFWKYGGTLASYYGGEGANANSYNGGGGGGSSAGTSSNGNDATGTSGGAAPAGGRREAMEADLLQMDKQVLILVALVPGLILDWNNNYSGGDGGDGKIIITYNLATATTTTTSNVPSIVYGTPSTTLSATVSPNPGGGTIQFKIDGNSVGSPVTVSGGSATLAYNSSSLNAGNHIVTAVFNGYYTYSSSTSSGVNLTVTPKPIIITGISANSKVYDGSASATFTGASSSDIINGDAVTYTVYGTFIDKNAGTNKTVNISGVTLGGSGAGNYSISSYSSSVIASIFQRPLTITAATNTKNYDGNVSAAATPTITSGVVQGSDVANFSESYDNANAGTGKTLTPTGQVSDGNSGNNYTYTFISSTGTINRGTLIYTANPESRAYGTANPTFTGTITGFISGESQATATTGTLTFSTTATSASDAGSYPITGSGLSATNYNLVQAAGNATALTITKDNLTITAKNQVKCAGTAFVFDGTEFTASGLVNGDEVTSVTLTSAGVSAGASSGTYDIVPSGATGSGLNNYDITYNNGTLSVNARPMATITSPDISICDPGTTNITGSVTVVGPWTLVLSNGATATGNGNGTFSIAVNPTTTTTYTITSINDGNCSSETGDLSGSTKVTVNAPVQITTQPQSQTSCATYPVTFSVTASGTGLSYQWFKDGAALTDNSNI